VEGGGEKEGGGDAEWGWEGGSRLLIGMDLLASYLAMQVAR
jgi:hypothetical protein